MIAGLQCNLLYSSRACFHGDGLQTEHVLECMYVHLYMYVCMYVQYIQYTVTLISV